MSDIDPRADTPLVNWSELGVSELLPTGTVTLLLADVEGSTRLWETQPEEMTAAVARLDRWCPRPSPPTTGCARSNKARATASWWRSGGPPTRWRARWGCSGRRWPRSGCASGCTPARSNCATKATTSARPSTAPRGCATWPTAARPCCRARPNRWWLDRLPEDAWLTDLGTHPLRDLPRPERVVQLCHPDLVNEFPPLRVAKAVVSQHLPVQLTSFVGRDAEIAQVRRAAGREPAGDPDRCGRGGQNPAGDPGRRPRRPASSPTGCGTWIWRRSPTPSWCP